MTIVYLFDYRTFMFDKAPTAVEEIAGTDPRELARDEVVPALENAVRMRRRWEAIEAGLTARVDDDGIYADAGIHARDTKDLLERFGLSGREANQRVLAARTFQHFPTAEAAFAAGKVGIEHVATLGRVVNPQTVEVMRQDERVMTGWAETMPYRKFAARVGDWAAEVDPAKHDAAIAPTTVTLTKGSKGRGILHADLCSADFTKWNAQLSQTEAAILRQEDADRKAGIDVPESTYDERLGQAFTIVLARARSGPDDRISNASRAQVSLVVTRDQLEAGRGGHDLLLDQPVAPDVFAEFCCDADLYRTVMGAKSEILDLGRIERTASTAQRKAIVVRDRHCIIPHCDAPPRWCEIHHVVWFRNGGGTTITNLALVCGRHHRQIHAGKIRVSLIPDRPQQFRFENEHGIELRRPPDLETERKPQAA